MLRSAVSAVCTLAHVKRTTVAERRSLSPEAELREGLVHMRRSYSLAFSLSTQHDARPPVYKCMNSWMNG